VQGWSSDGVGVVWETFYYAAVGEVDDCLSSFQIGAFGQISEETCYFSYDQFGLPKAGTHNSDGDFGLG